MIVQVANAIQDLQMILPALLHVTQVALIVIALLDFIMTAVIALIVILLV